LYETPGVKPVNAITPLPACVIVAVKPPGADVAVYEMMGEPPLFVGAVNETSAVVAPVRVAITFVGKPGLVAVAVAGVETNDSNELIKMKTSVKRIVLSGAVLLIFIMASSRSKG
jgi:hypothetical protein